MRARTPDAAIAVAPEADRPRELERRLCLIRWFGIGLGLYLVSQAGAGPIPVAAGVVPAVTALLALLGAANLALSVLLARACGDRSIARAGAAMFVADAATVIAIVWLFGSTRNDPTWALLYVLPLEGALRYEMRGALGVLVVCAVSELAREGFLAIRDPSIGYVVPDVAFRIGVGVMVASVAGLMSRSLRHEADRLRDAIAVATHAEREASTLTTVILAGVRRATAGDAMTAVAEAVGRRTEAERCVIVAIGDGSAPLGSWSTAGPARPLVEYDQALVERAIERRGPVVRRPTGPDRDAPWTLVAPLGSGRDVLGAILVECPADPASAERLLVLLSRLAVQIGLILQDVRIREEQRETLREIQRQQHELRAGNELLRRSDDQRRRLLSRLVAAQEQERRLIAARIEDEPLQDVVAIELRLANLQRDALDAGAREHLASATDTVRRAIRRLRGLLSELEPAPLDRVGIVATLHAYIDEIRPAADVRITSHLSDEPTPETAVIAYRLAQQGLVNAVRHADADEVEILLREMDRGIYLRIADDGEGLAGDRPATAPRELALAEMRERAELAGGWSHLLSAPGAGTIVECWVPLGARAGRSQPPPDLVRSAPRRTERVTADEHERP